MVRGVSRAFRATRTTWRRLWRDESGSVMSFLVVVPVLMGAVAVGLHSALEAVFVSRRGRDYGSTSASVRDASS